MSKVGLLIYGYIIILCMVFLFANNSFTSAFCPSNAQCPSSENPDASAISKNSRENLNDSAISKNSSAPSFQTYSNSEFGVALEYPSDWTVHDLKNGFQVLSNGETAYLELRTDVLKGLDKDLKQYADEDIAERKKSRVDLNILTELLPITISGDKPAYQITYTFKKTNDPHNGEIQKILRIYSMSNNMVYKIAYVSTSDHFGDYFSTGNEIINSINIADSKEPIN